jgi:hypothetical protein
MSTTKTLYVERVTLGGDGQFVSSKVVRATDEQIRGFRGEPCSHRMEVDKLIYDEPGHPYDTRYCGVCDQFIGFI